MSNGIKVGDLVMVVKPQPCCGGSISCGIIGIVSSIKTTNHCKTCKTKYEPETAAELASRLVRLSRLKKIDPPAEGDSLPTRADLEISA